MRESLANCFIKSVQQKNSEFGAQLRTYTVVSRKVWFSKCLAICQTFPCQTFPLHGTYCMKVQTSLSIYCIEINFCNYISYWFCTYVFCILQETTHHRLLTFLLINTPEHLISIRLVYTMTYSMLLLKVIHYLVMLSLVILTELKLSLDITNYVRKL